jgi:hypothetical protein
MNIEKIKGSFALINKVKDQTQELKEKLESTWQIHESKNVLKYVNITDYHENKSKK